MKRYYISELIGTGGEFDPYRPAIADEGVNHVAVYPPQDPVTGQYQGTSCLVLVNTINHARLMAKSQNRALPDFPLDGKINAMRSQTVSEMNAELTSRSFAASWSNSDGYRDVIRAIGRQLDPSFHEDNFDVSES